MNQRASTRPNLLESKYHQVLAITNEMLAFKEISSQILGNQPGKFNQDEQPAIN
jgi:hypothetical protein